MGKPAKRTIDGMQFSIEPVGGWEQIPLAHSLLEMLGSLAPVLSKLFTDKQKGIKLIDMDVGALLAGLPEFLTRAPPEKLRSTMELLLGPCMVKINGKELRLLDCYDTEMQGKMGTSLKLLAWALEVNFGGFLSGALAAAAAKKNASDEEARATEGDSKPSSPTPPVAG